MSNAVPWTVLAVTIAVALCTLPRHPWVKARRRERVEREILARNAHPAVRSHTHVPAQFYEGPVPSHEDCPVLPGEEILFGWIAGDLGYGWIADALKASREGREQ